MQNTIYTGDNLYTLRGFEDHFVDLIYLDPPFNSNRNYAAPIGSKAAGTAFKDTWTLNDMDERECKRLAKQQPALWHYIDAVQSIHGDSMMSYLVMMATRLIEMKRVLKPTGSIYLHCDPTASHYLKLLMDSIFGKERFRNEIVWCYSSGGASKKRFAKKHDTLLYYAGKDHTFNTQRIPYTSAMSRDPKHMHKFHPEGKIMLDWWDDLPFINPLAKERCGYPTQKPLALLERIIKASSNPGDLVLDPFCGCATTCVAAEKLGRRWIGIDISREAYVIIKERFKKEFGIIAKTFHHEEDYILTEME